MAAPRISRRRIEARSIGLAGALSFGEGVVDFEYDALGAVIAVVFVFVFAAHDGECIHDVRRVDPVQAVKMEEGRV